MDMDFRVLRSHPIYKKGNYYLVYGYFLLELNNPLAELIH